MKNSHKLKKWEVTLPPVDKKRGKTQVGSNTATINEWDKTLKQKKQVGIRTATEEQVGKR